MALASVDSYLASLPNGLDSYPECEHKGEPLAVWLRQSAAGGLAPRLPREVAAFLDPGRAFPDWVPEVHANVLYLAIRDARFEDDESFVAHAHRCNRAVLDTPTNRLLFWVAAPKAILRAAGARWRSLHRGSSIEVLFAKDTSAQVVLRYPACLFPAIVLRGTATGFVAALANAGARDVRLDLVRAGPTDAVFDGRWR